MRVTLPDHFLEEYWDKPQSARRVVVPSAFALLLAHGQDEAVAKLQSEGWSREFSAWLIPKVETFRSDLEIDAIPAVPDFDREVANFKAWKERKKKKLTVAWAFLGGHILCFLVALAVSGSLHRPNENDSTAMLNYQNELSGIVNLTIALDVVGIILMFSFIWFLLVARGRSGWYFLVAAVLPGISILDGLSVHNLVGALSSVVGIISGLTILGFLFVPDVNKQVPPSKPANFDSNFAILQKIRSIQAAEKA